MLESKELARLLLGLHMPQKLRRPSVSRLLPGKKFVEPLTLRESGSFEDDGFESLIAVVGRWTSQDIVYFKHYLVGRDARRWP